MLPELTVFKVLLDRLDPRVLLVPGSKVLRALMAPQVLRESKVLLAKVLLVLQVLMASKEPLAIPERLVQMEPLV